MGWDFLQGSASIKLIVACWKRRDEIQIGYERCKKSEKSEIIVAVIVGLSQYIVHTQ